MLALSTAAIARLFGVGADWTGAIVERESRLDAAWYSMWRKRGWKITGSKKVIKWGWRKMSTFYMIDSETPYLLPSRSGSDRFWAEKKKRAEPPTSCFPRPGWHIHPRKIPACNHIHRGKDKLTNAICVCASRSRFLICTPHMETCSNQDDLRRSPRSCENRTLLACYAMPCMLSLSHHPITRMLIYLYLSAALLGSFP